MQSLEPSGASLMVNANGTLAELYELMNSTIFKTSGNSDLSQELAGQLIIAIADVMGGHSFYLPRGAAIKRWVRDQQLYQDWKGGMAHSDLVKKYKLSSAIVYRALSKARVQNRTNNPM